MLSENALVQFQHLPVACVLLDANGRFLAANFLAQEHLNVSEKRLIGKNIDAFLAPKSEIDAVLQRSREGMIVTSDSFYTIAAHKPYLLHYSQQDDGNISVVLTAEGNRLEAEEESRRYEVAETVARIALERAHEIKNPLAALRGATQLLSEQMVGDNLEIVSHLLSEIDSIKERVDSFLQVGPRANVAMTPVNIHALIDDVCKSETTLKVQRAFDPGIPDIIVHQTRLRQALENLWCNAIEADSDLIVWETRIEHGVPLLGNKGSVLSIKITSNGHEIPKHIQHKLFEPYVTGKDRGNGLGLSVVQQVAHEHGGKVKVKSEVMRTSFTMYLPLRSEKSVGKK